VTVSARPREDIPLESSIPGAPLASILLTEELHRRPPRSPEYEKENSALAALVTALADSPDTILQTLAGKVLEVLHAGSAGLSLVTKDERRFYWAAIAGAWATHLGGGTPRNFGPCGDVLDHNVPMLFTHWERRYPYLSVATPLADEGLLVPFYVNGKAVGTIWAIAHDETRKFDAEDLRLLKSMGRFASAAYQAVESIKNLRSEITAREKAESEVRALATGLEAQVRVRTEQLERNTRDLLNSNQALEREISERKRAENSLRRSEALLAEAQRLSSTGSFSWRVATDEITWSEELYRIYEVEVGTPVTLELIRTRIHPEDTSLPEKMKSVDQASAGGTDFEWQYRLMMPDRSLKYMHAVAHATRDQEGQLEYIAAVQDVTAHLTRPDRSSHACPG
jgi:PAS domain-containing protein